MLPAHEDHGLATESNEREVSFHLQGKGSVAICQMHCF